MRRRIWQGFTLIELLIVVAIIAILAAVAVPNFLEAQTRAKISRVKSDMRTVIQGAELYRTDNGVYPLCFKLNASEQPEGWIQPPMSRCYVLTTPIAYLASLPILDPFSPYKFATGNADDMWNSHYEWRNCDQFIKFNNDMDSGYSLALGKTMGYPACWIESRGPDKKFWMYGMWDDGLSAEAAMVDYDASNGTRSYGDIRFFSYGRANAPRR
ncbi:MAG TPA: prepilin-type N-terminal cleavage/methylation domain-containing protein [Candidatus Sumerlaeota bacterium]|nr:prepilin-type N-terminal cleavage/methylation domain-containing protein [Candidatus Sumerlaeota bacterium]HPS02847.1 prepilin-type N-terminal cleavage/methylation domain-containing protein [Candidatus Sumerlaeota bacterium]